MISVKSIGIIAIEIFLVSLVSGYRGWGDPACYNLKTVNIKPNDCLCALDQFFETSEVYTYSKSFSEESDVKSHGTCSVALSTVEGGCKTHKQYLRDAKSEFLKEMGGERGGMDFLITKCINNSTAGRVKIPEDPEFIRPTSLACNWLIEITATV